MKTSSLSRKKSCSKGNIILENLATKTINKIARSCEYLKRKGGKISPHNLIMGFLLMVSKQRNTYSSWATEIGMLENKTITKQALNERMKPETESLVKKLLEEKLREKINPHANKMTGLFKKFRNILIDDSTTLLLPDAFLKQYPGCISRGGKQQAMAKIHAQYNLTQNNFPFFHIHSFSNNDQSLSANVLPFLSKNDLCIRDLGFMLLDVVEKFIGKGIYFISRKNYHTFIYDIQTGAKINLAGELAKRKFLDTEILIGKEKHLKVRLVAIPLPPAQANERKRKARRGKDKRANHSRKYYELLGYSIYITNIGDDYCKASQIADLYKLRWRIETIFKCWKSCFSLEKLINHQCKSSVRVNCTIYLMLLYIYLFHVVWWNHCERKVRNNKSEPQLSILKIANFFRQHFAQLLTTKSEESILTQLQKHCTYDKRKDRDNTRQIFFKLAA